MSRNSFVKRLFLPLIAALFGTGIIAQAAPATVTAYSFTGLCYDCTGTGTGTLYLTDYTPGAVLDTGNFDKFTYSSNLLTYTINSASVLTGSLTTTTGPAFLALVGDGYTLSTMSAGAFSAWCTGTTGACGSDYGLFSSFSYLGVTSVPEPATWGLMLGGFALAGSTLRIGKRARRTQLV